MRAYDVKSQNDADEMFMRSLAHVEYFFDEPLEPVRHPKTRSPYGIAGHGRPNRP